MAKKTMTADGLNTVWALDFGTTTTYLADSISGIRSLSPDKAEEYLPSIYAKAGTGKHLVGHEALDTGKPDEIVRSVKAKITQKEQSMEIDHAIVAILQRVYESYKKEIGSSEVRIGCPAQWDKQQRSRLMSLAARAGFNVGEPIVESVAACASWFQSQITSGQRPAGRIVVFDMGGGTLDIAVVDLDATFDEPEINVLSSLGNELAGDQVDREIFSVLLEKQSEGSKERQALLDYPGQALLLAEQLKKNMGTSSSATGTLKTVGKDFKFELTKQELSKVIKPVAEKSFALILESLKAAQLAVWVDPKDKEWSSRNDWGAWFSDGPLRPGNSDSLSELTVSELFSEVSNFVLVGGMSKMPLLRQALVDLGIDEKKISQLETQALDKEVVLGLVSDSYEHLALDRPGIEILLEWTHRGEPRREVLYQPYSKFYSDGLDSRDGYMRILWRCGYTSGDIDGQSSKAKFVIRDISGEVVPLTLDDGTTSQFLDYSFAGHGNTPVIILQPNGRIFMRDAQGTEQTLKVQQWPIIRAAGASGRGATEPRVRYEFLGNSGKAPSKVRLTKQGLLEPLPKND